jgi:hypothetical protein
MVSKVRTNLGKVGEKVRKHHRVFAVARRAVDAGNRGLEHLAVAIA